jgi:TRAP-type C4-dicarboxylate transport system permease small subunit
MLFCNALFLSAPGACTTCRSPTFAVVGISMIWVFGIGYIVAVVMGAINLNVLWRLVTGRCATMNSCR